MLKVLVFLFTLSHLFPNDLISPYTLAKTESKILKNNDFLSFEKKIASGSLLYKSLFKFKKTDLMNLKIGYKGNNLTGITSRQIPGGPSLYKKNVNGVVLVIRPEGDGIGSGSIISNDGYIITNWHVIDNCDQVLIYFYDKSATTLDDLNHEKISAANVINIDKERDLALLKLIGDKNEYDFLSFGNEYSLEIAQDVFAIGHPENLIWSFSYGVISQFRKNFEWPYSNNYLHVADVIQTQTPINPGNSGGPLFDSKGKLIGINTFKSQKSDGLNFAINLKEIKSFFKDSKNGLFQYEKKEKTLKEDFMDWEAVDINNNGVPDGYRKRTDEVVILMVDENEDEKIDMVLKNYDNNDVWDVTILDKDEDGFPEYWMLDEDNDGKIESTGIDTNQDGVPDYFL